MMSTDKNYIVKWLKLCYKAYMLHIFSHQKKIYPELIKKKELENPSNDGELSQSTYQELWIKVEEQ